MRRRISGTSIVVSVCLAVGTPAAAASIGIDAPLLLPAVTQNSRVIYTEGVNTLVNETGNPLTVVNALFGSAYAEAQLQTFLGAITTTGTPADGVVQAGSFTRDQALFSTGSGVPANLEFVFDVSYTLALNPGGSASFYAALDNAWANAAFPSIPYQVYSEHHIVAVPGTNSFTLKLRTNDLDPTASIPSGWAFPFSLGLHGRATEATFDWSKTIQLIAVNAYDVAGNPLSPSEFNVQFNGPFAEATVPEPTAVALIGTGLLMLARRRTV